ncbi:glycine zipper domain-containing protein [Paraburkholderia sp. J63]|uniref:glycine zipper domain-containing protein n=1 Tax=Paraburkholderia sp. J63 TaxID=2805434 RepID=UPI002ABDE523|nr:glycine zipper domain-containing protein [Paraburkholderia sp. J63]
MSLIVAGRFTTFPAAEAVAEKLFARGFVEEDVNLFFVNPRGQHAHPTPHHAHFDAAHFNTEHRKRHIAMGAAAGAVVGIVLFGALLLASLPSTVIAAAVGAWIGARIGAGWQRRAEHEERVHRETRQSGVLLAVHVSAENQATAAEVLREAGANDVERASGQWHGGHWADFDPTQAPTPYGQAGAQQA